MRAIALALVVLTLAGCEDPKSERLEIADVNARNALARTEELSARIEALEARVDELEAKLGE